MEIKQANEWARKMVKRWKAQGCYDAADVEALETICDRSEALEAMLGEAVEIDLGNMGTVQEMGGCWQTWTVLSGWSPDEYRDAVTAFLSLKEAA